MTQYLAVDFERTWEETSQSVVDFLPRFAAFLLILIVGWIVAKVLAKLTDTVLERVGFDRAVERGGVKQALARSRYDASDLVAKLVYYTIILLTLMWAFSMFGENNAVSELLADVVAFLPKLALAIIIVVIAAAIAKAVKDIVSNVLSGVGYGNILATVASVIILALGVIAALQTIDVAVVLTNTVLIAVLATVAGILVVGVGGGLIQPMSRRWESMLTKAEEESSNLKAQVQQNKGAASSTLQGYSDKAKEVKSDAQAGSNQGNNDPNKPGSTVL